jgi:hypothetical protein
MRKTLLASAAIIGASTGAWAQSDGAPPPSFQSQGMTAMPWAAGPGAQNNNNSYGQAHPGGTLVPTPGTVVIRLNGKVQVDFAANFTSADRTAFAGGGGYKLNPISAASFFRLYPGVDGMAANGMRYGAAVEIRENFENGASLNSAPNAAVTQGVGAASASGVSSAQTLFVRRAFVYLGSDEVGIVRLGQQDGLPGLFDYTGIFTTGSWDGGIGNLNNSGFQSTTPNQFLISWAWLSGNGTEYGNNKIVYLTPQFAGFDFGVEYAPNQGNSYNQSVTSSPYQTQTCLTAGTGCANITGGIDGTRWYNRVGVGMRYMGSFGGVDIKAYGVYVASGHESIPGGGIQGSPANILAGAGTLKYDGQSAFNGGAAVSAMGFTANADVTFGRINGSNALTTTGGASMAAVLAGLSYANGPFSMGTIVGLVDSQGAAALTKTSQRHEFAVAVGGAYKIAPGMNIAMEYQYEQRHQGSFNFNTGGVNTAVGNDIHGQGVQISTIMNW